MFKRKKCQRCNSKVKEKDNFCSSCGINLKKEIDKKEWGMLGQNDFENIVNEIKLPAGMNLLFNSLAKTLDKQFKEMDKEMKKQSSERKVPRGISISIATGGVPQGMNINQPQEKKQKQRFSKNISEDKLKKIASLPKKEPTTSMKRLSDTILYEIDIPGVKKIEDISINSLENSIEIKALAKDKAYMKIIPFGLPILKYSLEKDKLILELDTN